jgi:hypothetical protein
MDDAVCAKVKDQYDYHPDRFFTLTGPHYRQRAHRWQIQSSYRAEAMYFALEGLGKLLNTIKIVESDTTPAST